MKDLNTKVFSFVSEGQVIQFGSTLNGLAMVGSDVDFTAFLNITEAGTAVQQATEVFQQYPHIFTDFVTFPGSIEFLSMQHIPTGVHVDVIFNDSEGITNTDFCNYLFHLDERVYQLVMIVKHWAILHKLTRERVLSNYSMTLLVVFYLQQKDILPSIASLQIDVEPYIIDGWNKAINKMEYKPRIHDSVYHLLGGFFEYYDTFDYEKNIISPFVGRPIERKLFKDLQSVPDEFNLYRRNVEQGVSRPLILKDTPVIIQDPFTHFDNLAKHLRPRSYYAFIAQMNTAALQYRNNNKREFLDSLLDRSYRKVSLSFADN